LQDINGGEVGLLKTKSKEVNKKREFSSEEIRKTERVPLVTDSLSLSLWCGKASGKF
jgi:hypothetical protein